MTAKWSRWRYLEARFVTILTIRFKGALVPAWPADRSPTRTGPVEADGAVDAQNAPTAPWKTLLVFHELPQGFPHPITHDKPRKSPESYWETRIDPNILKRLLIHAGGFNLGLVMRHLIGVGTPRGLQGHLATVIATLLALIRATRRRLVAIAISQPLLATTPSRPTRTALAVQSSAGPTYATGC